MSDKNAQVQRQKWAWTSNAVSAFVVGGTMTIIGLIDPSVPVFLRVLGALALLAGLGIVVQRLRGKV